MSEIEGTIRTPDKRQYFPRGKKRRILEILTQDFYRPQLLGAIFSELYPGEVLNLESSPHRVRKMISILNHDLSNQKIDIRVQVRNEGFYISEGNSAWILTADRKVEKPVFNLSFQKWLENIEKSSVDRHDIEKKFNLSKSTANRWLQKGLKDSLLKRGPNGSKTRYQPVKTKAA